MAWLLMLADCRKSTCGNACCRIEGLDALLQLKRLNLSCNSIAKVDSLAHLSALEHLQLQGNRIEGLGALNLQHIAQLRSLKALYLQNLDRTQQNGCCRQAGYKTQVLQALPGLTNLDGERWGNGWGGWELWCVCVCVCAHTHMRDGVHEADTGCVRGCAHRLQTSHTRQTH